MKKNGNKSKQKPKPEKNHLPQGPRVHRIQEIPLMERDISPPPFPKDHTRFIATLVTFVISLIMLVIIISINHYTNPQNCSKAEFFVHKICMPKLDRLRILTNMTIPDFSMTPIGRDIAEKCNDVEECLSTIHCAQLYRSNQLPDRCLLFQFFHTRFAECREKLDRMKNPPECVRRFFIEGPVTCDVLNDHLKCYKQNIQRVCEPNDYFWRRFDNHIHDYMDIIQCGREEEEEEEEEDDIIDY